MKIKEFAQLAIKNGYDRSNCNGWDWIRDNLSLLDYIFQTKEYKQQKGMKYSCMPLIVGEETLSELEQSALSTAWYLNNDRERNKQKDEYANKMIADEWLKLDEDTFDKAFSEGKKIQVSASIASDWMNVKVNEIFKVWKDKKGNRWLMKPRAKIKGYYLHRFENAFCKII